MPRRKKEDELPPDQRPGPPRGAANARERTRMRVLSKAFGRLKLTLPWVPPDTKLSKLDTLRLATSYIGHLQRILDDDSSSAVNKEDSLEDDHKPPQVLGLRSWPYGQSRLLSCQRQQTNGRLLPSNKSIKSHNSSQSSKPTDKPVNGQGLKHVKRHKVNKPAKAKDGGIQQQQVSEIEGEVDRPNSTSNDCGGGQVSTTVDDILPESPSSFVHYSWHPTSYRQNHLDQQGAEYFYNQTYPDEYVHY